MLIVDGVTMRYRGAPAPVLEDVSLEVAAGRILPLLGGNGVGKTTLLKIVCGLIEPSRGTVRVGGADTVRNGVAARAALGVSLYPERSFYFRLTVRQNLRYFASLRGLFGRAARVEIDDVLDAVGLADIGRTAFMRLSLGQRKRLGVARSMLGSPPLIVLDEPTANLDADSTAAVHRIMRERRASGATVLFSTHQVQDLAVAVGGVLRIADRRLSLTEIPNTTGPTRRVDVVATAAGPVDLSAVESRYRLQRRGRGFSVELPVEVALADLLGELSRHGVLVESVHDDRWVAGPGRAVPRLEEAS